MVDRTWPHRCDNPPCCDKARIVPTPGVVWYCQQHGYTEDPHLDRSGNWLAL